MSATLIRRSLLKAAPLVGGTVVVLVEKERDKLPIYPISSPDIVLLDTPSTLEIQIGTVRKKFTKTYSDAYSQVQGVVSKWIGVEHAIESRVKALIPPTESITPGILYVGIATLSGSIIARNRLLVTRLILPPTLFVLSMNHFLPQTFANISEYLGSLEDTYFPTVAQKHAVANAHTRMGLEMLQESAANGKQKFDAGVETTVDKIQESTGLKLREAMGWGKSVTEKVESKVLDAVNAVEKKEESPKTDEKFV
ncbi:uncharacterized protein BT62DRAFT_316138 [Guyanagaster necrorhizus]|uniref:MICOS complex subunit n=1 Tax=Guyanagaster necrorhizus TaxID=856835 RepID=A0A9P8APY5_9AGAR|nr:uncharacterized protein BT62DRAFT_316138 [Guyanagaster necrorhizus MCA 3950]KAG7443823.1 hypothetical protein BT62DRAFT_316138 [Guyanagaster necrorhizus MCA 3950]